MAADVTPTDAATSTTATTTTTTTTAEAQLPATAVQADKVGDEPTRGYQPRTTAVAGGGEKAITDVPQAVAVVSHQVIQDQAARSLDDVLANVSGVVQTNTLGGVRDSFLKRGFGNNADGSILVDGIRTSALHSYLATIDRVEVLKGPASLMYGIQQPGGVINMITKKPEDEFGGSVSYSKTSHGGNGGSIDLTGPIGQPGQIFGGTLAFRIIAEDNTTQYWRSFGKQRDALVAPMLSWHNADTRIDVSYQYVDYVTPFDRGTVLVNGHINDALRYRRNEESWSQDIGTQETFRAKAEHRLSDDWRVMASFGWTRDRYDQYITRLKTFNATTGAMTRTSDANLGRNESDELATVGALGNVTLFGMKHDLYVGGEYERQRTYRGDTIRGATVSGFNLYNPVYGLLSTGGTPSATQSDYLVKVHTLSLVTQDTVHFTDRFSASAGVRWENWRQYSGVGRPFVVAENDHGSTWLPQLGLVYRLTPTLSAYANYSKSFVPNTPDNANSPLAPETGRVFETGLKFEPTPGITGTLAAYQIDKHNVAVTVGDVTETIGTARSRGVELDVAGQLTRQWSVIGSYAYTDAVNRSANLPMVNAPRNMGSLFVVYNTALPEVPGRWRFGGGMRMVGKRPGDTANSFTLPGYAVADVFAAWDTKLGKFPTRVQLNVKNLFDKAYYTSSASNLIIAVGEARLVTLTTTLSF